MGDGDQPSGVYAEEVGALFQDGGEYARTLLEENARLREQLAQLEARARAAGTGGTGEGTGTDGDAAGGARHARLSSQLREVATALEEERRSASRALAAAEARNQQLAERCVEVESEYDTLGSLYVATHQLHSTLDLAAVYRTLTEVAIELVGAEVMAVFGYDERRRKLVVQAAEGAPVARFPSFEVGSGTVGEAVARGKIHSVAATASRDPQHPIICVPFLREREPLGALAIYKLLRQKAGLTPLDHELFRLLAGHAATAIYAARLYSESKRKLDTMQGFLELMRPSSPPADGATGGGATRGRAGSPVRSSP